MSGARMHRWSKSLAWQKVVLQHDALHAERGTLSLPRFHFLSLVWALIELTVFLITLAQTDYSFQWLDLVSEFTKASNDEAFLEQARASFDPQKAILTINNGAISLSDYCGPPPGTAYFQYIHGRALSVIRRSRLLSSTAAERKREEERLGETGERVTHSFLSRSMIEDLVCNRTQPLVDQRYIISTLSQSCKGPVLLPSVRTLACCNDYLSFGFYLEVLGVGSVSLQCFPLDDPLSSWSAVHVLFTEEEVQDYQAEWILEQLRPIWTSIRVSGLSWVFLSIVMRAVYWASMVRATKRMLHHLKVECPVVGTVTTPVKVPARQPSSEKKKKKSGTREQEDGKENDVPRPLLVRPCQPGSATTVHPFGSATPPPEGKCTKTTEALRFLTACSLGLASANNNAAYQCLAIVRQIIGSYYAEILTAATATTFVAAWQAVSIVVYHAAVICLISRALRLLLGHEQRLSGVSDIGIWAYFSLFIMALNVQVTQALGVDMSGIFSVSNALIGWVFWWLVFPDCGVKGPCPYTRGDIVTHTVCAFYTAGFAILIQIAREKWKSWSATRRERKGQRRRSSVGTGDGSEVKVPSFSPKNGGGEGSMKLNNGQKEEEEVGTARPWCGFLAVLGCPHCGLPARSTGLWVELPPLLSSSPLPSTPVPSSSPCSDVTLSSDPKYGCG